MPHIPLSPLALGRPHFTNLTLSKAKFLMSWKKALRVSWTSRNTMPGMNAKTVRCDCCLLDKIILASNEQLSWNPNQLDSQRSQLTEVGSSSLSFLKTTLRCLGSWYFGDSTAGVLGQLSPEFQTTLKWSCRHGSWAKKIGSSLMVDKANEASS